jgi:hypothetical protein
VGAVKNKKLLLNGIAIVLVMGLSLVIPQMVLAAGKEVPPKKGGKDGTPAKGLPKEWEIGQYKGWDKKNPGQDKGAIKDDTADIKIDIEEAEDNTAEIKDPRQALIDAFISADPEKIKQAKEGMYKALKKKAEEDEGIKKDEKYQKQDTGSLKK